MYNREYGDVIRNITYNVSIRTVTQYRITTLFTQAGARARAGIARPGQNNPDILGSEQVVSNPGNNWLCNTCRDNGGTSGSVLKSYIANCVLALLFKNMYII